ncbi:alpha-2,8-sialyltransferase 8B-like [Diadema setosum]|uniref:alpha-2,8-sialyltransferase 8B-like n=1 Tax=Diadema setosum TaxID=31175 RepID=UPI003B3AF70E
MKNVRKLSVRAYLVLAIAILGVIYVAVINGIAPLSLVANIGNSHKWDHTRSCVPSERADNSRLLSNLSDLYNGEIEENVSARDHAFNDRVQSFNDSQQLTKNGSLTKKLWEFRHETDQAIYLYESLLQKQSHFNIENVLKFRSELASHHRSLNGTSMVILHHQNIKVDTVIRHSRGGMKLQLKPEIYDLFPETGPFSENKTFRSCAVVGNSGSLLGSKCGKEIDSSDFVMRCNLPKLEPFKDDAGVRSNLTTLNPSMVGRVYKKVRDDANKEKLLRDLSSYHGFIWMPCLVIGGNFGYFAKVVEATKGHEPPVLCGHPEHFKYAGTFWTERAHIRWTSSGFYLVTLAIQLCDEVNLFGFWPFPVRYNQDEEIPVPYHYYDKLSNAFAKSHHTMDKEFSLLVQLHNLGVIKLHVGPCGQ